MIYTCIHIRMLSFVTFGYLTDRINSNNLSHNRWTVYTSPHLFGHNFPGKDMDNNWIPLDRFAGDGSWGKCVRVCFPICPFVCPCASQSFIVCYCHAIPLPSSCAVFITKGQLLWEEIRNLFLVNVQCMTVHDTPVRVFIFCRNLIRLNEVMKDLAGVMSGIIP